MNQDIYASPTAVSMQPVDTRAAFIRKTYAHLAGAIGVFALLEYLLLGIPAVQNFAAAVLSNRIYWFATFGVFMVTSWIGQSMAHSAQTKSKQYIALALVVGGWTLMFIPILYLAPAFGNTLLLKASILTGSLFAGLTFIALTTKKDFSFFNGFLKIGSFVILGLIGVSMLGGFSLGIWFVVGMIVFSSISILRDTSNVVHHYRTDQYIGASASLFASFALLLWYVIQLLMSLSRN